MAEFLYPKEVKDFLDEQADLNKQIITNFTDGLKQLGRYGAIFIGDLASPEMSVGVIGNPRDVGLVVGMGVSKLMKGKGFTPKDGGHPEFLMGYRLGFVNGGRHETN